MSLVDRSHKSVNGFWFRPVSEGILPQTALKSCSDFQLLECWQHCDYHLLYATPTEMELESDARWGPLQTTSQHFLCFTGMKGTKFTIQSHLFYFYLPTKISVNEENMHRTSSKILIEYSYLATVPFARNLCNNMTVCLIIRFSLSLQPNNMTICPIIRFSLSLQPNWYAVCKVAYFYSHQPVCE